MAGTSSDALLAGRYRLVERLGSGGVATVFLAEDERLGRLVAVKRLGAESPEELAKRFEREARLGASLNHPNLVAVYDAAPEPSGVAIVMEYVEGRTLADALREGPIEPPRALRILRDVADGLDHAHAHGVVHRDVKPANVLLGDDGRVKVTDLGIATAAEATRITAVGTVLGTASYMAPEQLEGGDAGPAADVYALAAMAFEALSGRRARPGRSALEVAHRVTHEPPPDIREAWTDAPPPLAEALAAGMALNPSARPGTAGELVDRLEQALADRSDVGRRRTAPAAAPTAARSAPAPARTSRRRGLAWVVPAALLLVVVVAIVALASVGGEGEPGAEGEAPEAAPPAAEAPEPAPGGEGSGAAGNGGAEAPGAAGGGGAEAPSTPADTVVAFYERAAAGDYDAAWELAGPSFRQQLGGFGSFTEGQSTLESIEFERADTVSEGSGSAQVAIETVATHSDGVDQCEGTLTLVPGEGAPWVIDGASITCPESTRPGR